MRLLINTIIFIIVLSIIPSQLKSSEKLSQSKNLQKSNTELINKQIEYLKINLIVVNDSIKNQINILKQSSQNEDYDYGIYWSLYFQGRYYQLQYDTDSVFYYFSRLWQQIKNKSNYSELKHLTIIGLANFYWDTGDYSNGLAFIMEARSILEQDENSTIRFEVYNYTALFYEGILDYESALVNYLIAAEMALKVNDTGYAGIIISNTGRLFYKQDQFDKALEYYKKGVKLEIQDQLYRNAGRSFASIVTVFLKLNQTDSASKYLKKAYANNLIAEDNIGLVRTKIADCKYHMAINRYKKSVEILNSTIPIANKFNTKSELVEIHKLLAQSYAKIGMYKESSNYYQKYINCYLDIYDIEKINQVNALQYQLRITKQENKINLLNIQKQKSIGYYLIIIIALLLILSVFSVIFVIYYRKNNKYLILSNLKISEQKEMLENLNQKLILAEQNANKADDLKSNFLNSLSHEIRTPLNSIVGFSALAFDDEISKDEKTEASKIIRKNSDDLISTIEGLVDLSLINSGQLYAKKEKFDVYKMLDKTHFVIDNIKENLSKDMLNVKFIPDKKHNKYILNSDSNLIQKTLHNILHNAIKFTLKGKVEYGFNISGSQITFFVSDTGPGISNDLINQLFSGFEKGSNISKEARGLGINLTLSRKYMELLGGEISVKSELNKGSTFYISLPLE